MTILLLLAPISVLLGLMAVGAFVWSLRAGQYDDMRGAAERILLDDAVPIPDRRDAEWGEERVARSSSAESPISPN